MLQLWVNLRAQDKSAAPAYQTLLRAQIPTVQLPNGAGTVRVIAGECSGQRGPAKTFTPINAWDIRLSSGANLELPVPQDHTTALFLLSGEIAADAQRSATEGDLVIFERSGEGIKLKSTTGAQLVLLSGEPINEPIVGRGPFVMNSAAEIQQAFSDFQLGKMGHLE